MYLNHDGDAYIEVREVTRKGRKEMFLGIPLRDYKKTWQPGAGRAAVVGCCTQRTPVREAGSRRKALARARPSSSL